MRLRQQNGALITPRRRTSDSIMLAGACPTALTSVLARIGRHDLVLCQLQGSHGGFGARRTQTRGGVAFPLGEGSTPECQR
jgi:hypothetical protein